MRTYIIFAIAAALLLPLPGSNAGGGVPTGPLNDHFSNAKAVDVLLRPYTVNVSNVGATLDALEPTPCGTTATVWYYTDFNRGASGPMSIDTFGSVPNTVVAVYAGSAETRFQNLQLVGCNDDAPGHGTDSQVTFDAKAGVTYYFQVGTLAAADPGSITFNVHGSTPPVLPQQPEDPDPI